MSGIGKGENYAVGDSEKRLSTRWNIVYADDEWHLAHVDWCIKSTKDDTENHSIKQAADFFFLTDPEDFAQFCFPDNYQWQLIDRPISKKEFLTQPNCRPKFYDLDGAVVKPDTCIAKAYNGKIEVELKFPKQNLEHLNLSFLLTYVDDQHTNDANANMLNCLEKFVVQNRKPARVVFEICLPVPGKYIFDVFGEIEKPVEHKVGENDKDEPNASETEVERLCQFKFNSDKTFETEELELLPECPPYGWGPGPVCRALGLVPKTHHEGVIFMKPGDIHNVVFKVQGNLEVTSQLTHTFLPVYELVEQVNCKVEHNEATIAVKLREEGQYALKIYCRETGHRGYNEACVYLIRQRTKTQFSERFELGSRRKHRDKMLRNRLEHHIKNHTSEQALEDAIEVYKCYNVPDHGELKRAQEKLKQYWEIKRELRGAAYGRNVTVSRKWLERAKRSKYKDDLEEEIRLAERMEANMDRLKGNPHPILKMDQETMIEIRNYNRPPRIVQDVMTATYTLLGERKDDVQDWGQIQYMMGKTGPDSLQKRVATRRAEDITEDMAKRAEAIIRPYDLKKCRAVSNGICSFYKWDTQMIREVKGRQEESLESRFDDDHPTNGYDGLDSHMDNESRPRSGSNSRLSQPKSGGSPDHKDVEENIVPEERDNRSEGNAGQFAPQPKFALTPSERQQNKPVEYAGWKPRDL